MCASVWIEGTRADGFMDEVENVGGLRKHCGFVYPSDGFGGEDLDDDICLCCVNIPATLIHSGFKVWIEPANIGLSIYSAEKVPAWVPTQTTS